ncbi:O-antigen ligase family protein, partial [Patescibacteria group bacterium]|nr:O-antigen ligase family protein [Patescibacteria group bacterium]
FKTTFLFIILAEILSFFGWLLLDFNTICFFVILFLCLILSLVKLEYGIYILLAELFIGSKGYLFSLEFGETLVSIRIGLFLVVMGVWAMKFLKSNNKKEYFNFKFNKNYLWLGIIVLFAFISGIIRSNNFGNVFLDFNNWLYFLLVFPVWRVARGNDKFLKNILTILSASVVVLFIKTIIIYLFFSLNIESVFFYLYHWERHLFGSQIVRLNSNLFRVLFLSNIYALISFFIFLPLTFLSKNYKNLKELKFIKILFLISLFIIIFSFFRSYWVAGIITFIFFLIMLKKYFGYNYKKIIKYLLIVLFIILLEFSGIFLLANTTLQSSKIIGTYNKNLKAQKSLFSSGEVAIVSRLNSLGPIFKKIADHPIVGSGFGTTVTYKSEDPRVQGEFTTYAFEWGYLDIVIKIGLVGLSIYLILLFKLLLKAINLIKTTKSYNLKMYFVGLILGMVVLLVTHIFSPYINHPLGIGYIILFSVFIEKIKIENYE